LEQLSQELDNLNDLEDGPMNILVKNYEGIIDDIDERIEREERRIALVEERLNRQFAAMETLLGQLSGQETYLQTLIEQLPGYSNSQK
jgi:flagellar hook-associated protein 2